MTSYVFAGDQSGQIHFEGYQVSNVCMALVNDDCLIPTKDAPELGYIKESSNEQYVPDVFYKVIIPTQDFYHFFIVVILCLTSHQQLRSYGDGATA